MAIERFDHFVVGAFELVISKSGDLTIFRIINILQIREANIFKNHDREVVQLFNNRG
jgi:hypothetical protein